MTAPETQAPHVRLTAEAVKRLWLAGELTPKGYLHLLLSALRKPGWWYRVPNVSQFCREWEIKRRTFYKAKSELVAAGILEEAILGAVEFRLSSIHRCASSGTPDDAQCVHDDAQCVHDDAQCVHDDAQCVHDDAPSAAEALARQQIERSPRSLTDLSSDLSSDPEAGREKEGASIAEVEPIAEAPATEPVDLLLAQVANLALDFIPAALRTEWRFKGLLPWRDHMHLVDPTFAHFVGKQISFQGTAETMAPGRKGEAFVERQEGSTSGIRKLVGYWRDWQAQQAQQATATIRATPPVAPAGSDDPELVANAREGCRQAVMEVLRQSTGGAL